MENVLRVVYILLFSLFGYVLGFDEQGHFRQWDNLLWVAGYIALAGLTIRHPLLTLALFFGATSN
jgi:hypothetical protein